MWYLKMSLLTELAAYFGIMSYKDAAPTELFF